MILAQENKCAMCFPHIFMSDEFDKKQAKEQRQEDNTNSSSMIVEQINGTCYTFDTAQQTVH
jgi:hypothetical protein